MDSIPGIDNQPRDSFLTDHLSRIIRKVCDPSTSPARNILVAFDELGKLHNDENPAVGELSNGAVTMIRGLGAISTQSFKNYNIAVSKREPPPGTIVVAASAMAAYHPAKGVTEGSNRPVFFMSLPPLDVLGYKKDVKSYASVSQRLCALRDVGTLPLAAQRPVGRRSSPWREDRDVVQR